MSLPMGLRFRVVNQPALLKRLEVRLVRAGWRLQRATARRLHALADGHLVVLHFASSRTSRLTRPGGFPV